MQDTTYLHVPIHAQDGTLRSCFLIDRDLASTVTAYRWKINSHGHVVRNVTRDGKSVETIHVARLILGLKKGDPDTADHINRNKLDNRRENLRAIPLSGQAQNRKRKGSSQFRGVCRQGSRWVARCLVDGKNHYLGTFDDEAEAGRVAREFRLAHMPYAVD